MGLALDIAYGLGALAASPVWAWRLARTGKWRTDWPARFGRCASQPHDHPTLLVHAVSVGEVNAVRSLVERFSQRTGGAWDIVVSATTDTGIARARSVFAPRRAVVRFPFDLSCSVKRFLDAVQPTAVALVENEVWPNFTALCRKRGIPVCVVNGRLTERSFGRYRHVAPLVRPMFSRLAAAMVQTDDYARRFAALGTPADRVHVLDTMKWDTAELTDTVAGSDELAAAMGVDRTRPLVVAGSTAPAEHQMLLDACPPEAQLMLVPRKPVWFDDAAKLAPDVVRRTQHPDGAARPCDGKRLFLLDTIGELRKAYALADVCVVGRTFVDLGGSDMIEPIALGKPTVIGPYFSNFADTVAAFRAADGLVLTADPNPALRHLLADRAAAKALADRGRGVILTRRGATDRHVDVLLQVIAEQTAASRVAS